MDKMDEAIKYCEKAIATDPENAEAHNNLSTVFKAQGNLDHATQEFRKAVELKPSYIEAYRNLLTTEKPDQRTTDVETLKSLLKPPTLTP